MRKKVLLYNPKAVFFDMPLALLAIGSALDPERYQVVIIDGRLDEEPINQIKFHLKEAICFGVTVITGAPIKDALSISQTVKDHAPNLPIIWGGWHTSLFPVQPLENHGFIDITVQGQGEETFVELIDCLHADQPLDNIKGIAYRKNGIPIKNQKRHLVDMNDLRPINYELIDVEKYFSKKQRRQFDYISSIGCFYRCAFCADPNVYERRFSSIDPVRMADQLEAYHDKYQFEDLNFQDETFFTYPKKIESFARELIKRKISITWAATMRADQGVRLSADQWTTFKKSGLRRLLIGVESGSQEMMDWMKKDIKITQVFECAEKCQELGIGVIFPFIVGFPSESDTSIQETIQVIKKLRKQSEHFDTPIFYFKPYPGSLITQEVVAQGYELPKSTEEWGDFDYIGSSGPWVSREKEKFFEAFKFYLKLGYGKSRGILTYPLRKVSQWRCKNDWFRFPVEKYLIEKIRPAQKLS